MFDERELRVFAKAARKYFSNDSHVGHLMGDVYKLPPQKQSKADIAAYEQQSAEYTDDVYQNYTYLNSFTSDDNNTDGYDFDDDDADDE